MEQLPNDVLLMVMEHLRVEDLFACRLVCKRLGALALHPAVWRRQSCDGTTCAGGAKAVCRVLRMAPRLHKLKLRLDGASHHLPYERTTCAVRELELSVNETSAVLAALVVRNQEALGRLRRVALTRHGSVKAYAGALYVTVASSPILKRLDVKFPPGLPFADGLSCAVHAPSLEYFQCYIQSGSEDFINFVLSGHASTLKIVDLGEAECVTAGSSSTASLLAGVANLHRLTCPLLPAMEDLAASESLTKLELHVAPGMRYFARAAAKFLGRARHLRDVTLSYRSDDRLPADVGVDLVGALAGPGQSGVEILSIRNEYDPTNYSEYDDDGETHPDLGPLARALPSMPALGSLRVDVYEVPVELLEAISPDTAPALHTVYLSPKHPSRDSGIPECAHAWRHEDSVQEFIARNPETSLEVFCDTMRCWEEYWICEFCEQGCHMDSETDKEKYFWETMRTLDSDSDSNSDSDSKFASDPDSNADSDSE